MSEAPSKAKSRPFVQVALPRAVDELFTYRVPDDVPMPSPGCRVLVPFGRERLTGLAVAHLAETEIEAARLRNIELVIDDEPSVPGALLELARFIAEYYLCPIGEVLKAMHPAGPTESMLITLTDEGRELDPQLVRGKRKQEVLGALRASDRVTLVGLRRRVGGKELTRCLRELKADGIVELRISLKEGPKDKEVRTFLATERRDAEAEAELTGRGSSRGALLTALRSSTDGRTVKELSGALGLTADTVRRNAKALSEAGLVTSGTRRLRRSPQAPAPDVEAGERDASRTLSDDQQKALDGLLAMQDEGRFEVMLIEGVTGSGKTEVYLRALAGAIERGRTGLYLVPEISITPLLLRTVRARFGERTAMLHSGLSQGERHDERQRILAGEVDLVLGARSAVFAPLPRLGLIVVDEEHESSYKQDSSPRYHGRDTAVMRARLEGVPVCLGSATPSLESYRNALAGRYLLKRMATRIGASRHAAVEVVDMRKEPVAGPRAGLFSKRLCDALDHTMSEGRQAMLLLNRRGWADFHLCRECGEPERCEHCAVTLTVHLAERELTCHYCDLRRPIPTTCPHCGGTFLQMIGQGTEQLEASLGELLAGVKVARLDRDIARRKGEASRVLQEFERGETQVLVGTQMIAKGHDFPGVTLVGVLQADRSLWMPDFRAAERSFQLLTQVAGRAGRRDEPGLVIVQSFSPEHPALALASRQDYPPFYEAEAPTREALAYPPFVSLTSLLISAEDEQAAQRHSEALASALRKSAEEARILGPAPAPFPRLRGRWRFQVLLKTLDRPATRRALRAVLARQPRREGVTVDIDADPQSLM